MGNSDFFEKGKRNEVYYEAGKFGTGEFPKFKKAPFDIIKTPVGQFVCPDCFGNTLSAMMLGSDDIIESLYEIYVCEPRIVIGENEMGDYNGAAGETWKGLHQFGPVM